MAGTARGGDGRDSRTSGGTGVRRASDPVPTSRVGAVASASCFTTAPQPRSAIICLCVGRSCGACVRVRPWPCRCSCLSVRLSLRVGTIKKTTLGKGLQQGTWARAREDGVAHGVNGRRLLAVGFSWAVYVACSDWVFEAMSALFSVSLRPGAVFGACEEVDEFEIGLRRVCFSIKHFDVARAHCAFRGGVVH